MLASTLNREEFTISTPAGPALVVIEDRLGFWDGPKGGTIAKIGFDSSRITVPRPETYDSDNGGPVDLAWQAHNAAAVAEMRVMLDAALPGIRQRTSGDPGTWEFSRYAGCTECPCTHGMIAQHRLTRNGRTCDIAIYGPGEL
jgi:hypothetical protein